MRPNLQFLGNGKLDFFCGVMSTFDDSDCPFGNLIIGISVSALSVSRAQSDPSPPPHGFSKNLSSKERVKGWFFVTFNIIISRIFHWNSSNRSEDMKSFSVNISCFHRFPLVFWIFLIFPCYKETNDVSLEQIMSPFLHFQHTSNCLIIV